MLKESRYWWFFEPTCSLSQKHQSKEILPSELVSKEMKTIIDATEGFFGIQDKNNSDDMLLMLDYGIFYEFIKQKNWNEENGWQSFR